MSSDGDDVPTLLAAFKKGRRRSHADVTSAMPVSQVPPPRAPVVISDSSTEESDPESGIIAATALPRVRRLAYVRTSPLRRKHDYTYHEPKDEIAEVLAEFSRRGQMLYQVRFQSDRQQEISFEALLEAEGGLQALQRFQPDEDLNATDDDMQLRDRKASANVHEFVDISNITISSSEEDKDELDNNDGLASESTRSRTGRGRALARQGRRRQRAAGGTVIDHHAALSTSEEDSDLASSSRKRGRRKKEVQLPTRRSARQAVPMKSYDVGEPEGEEDSDNASHSSTSDILRSDVVSGAKRKRTDRSQRQTKPEKLPRTGIRQSERATRATNNMQEMDMDDIYPSDTESAPKLAAQKVIQVREVFPPIPRGSLFRARHVEGCEVCYAGLNAGPLIYCQGCCFSYHKNCIGSRSTRDHLVTKVGQDEFVLQCKRCINFYKKRDATAPDLSCCQDCTQSGNSCRPFRKRKTTQQEMKEREENDGHDPAIDVEPELINNTHNVMFRCAKCFRAWHFHHLPALTPYAMGVNRDDEELADERFREYSKKWMCKECDDMGEKRKIGGIVAWRPSDVQTYQPGTPCEMISEDEKQYLIKWENESYFRSDWFSGAWTWGVTAAAMRKAFFKREDGPKMRTEDAVPEEYLRIDIVLDIKYTSIVDVRTENIDKARIKEVDRALIKYKGLGYEDAVWEKVPTSDDGDRWLDFVTAYNDWVSGRYIRYPRQSHLKGRLDKVRQTPFAKLERQKQPDNLVGGELMHYQIQGLNWLYYQWYTGKNCILADEMGLGKTIQVIGFMATLIQEHACFPFLIVVPNSTCANWRREIKQWAPSLRVVAYFGSAQAREMAHKYEMFPEGSKELRCHVVVTSYEAATDESCKRVFKNVSWAGLIVDEGQRLKNDKSQLYTALSAVRAPFRLLLTGTPLQNNTRELFNLLQFLDETVKAAELEELYAEMTNENVKELHDQIRPFILRRTKAQVLTFLPPLGQVILPVSMSHLQKEVYKTILSKKPELLKALFTSEKSLKQQERANLSNILMQLRKCLCHPFVYSREIEERSNIAAVSHRNLVEASAKLSLLELILPKLKEGGHRVLIFSQFLDMLSIIEDFLDGMELCYQRLDGTMGSLEKQKRIDHFNAPQSTDFAFLLSTRAGGVGINLATADTVIILDPDWNPHQDLQAIARAHRIGQKKKVLCLQLATRASVEEKIMQMGRKKMILDHVVVEQLDAEDIEDQDVESILKFGAAELFKENGVDHEIRYDEMSIDRLLDRSQIEHTVSADDKSTESQFSMARVWANDKGGLQEDFDLHDEVPAPDPGVWDKILKERQAAAAAEALARAEAMGRGRRAKAAVDYGREMDIAASTSATAEDAFEDALTVTSPVRKISKRRRKDGSESDTDFQVDSEDESEPEPEPETVNMQDSTEGSSRKALSHDKHNGAIAISTHGFQKVALPLSSTNSQAPKQPRGGVKISLALNGTYAVERKVPLQFSASNSRLPKSGAGCTKQFERAHLAVRSLNPNIEPSHGAYNRLCPACQKTHPQGACDLKVSGVEYCGLCGLAHYGHSRTCPHIKSETQVREMLQALKNSNEDKELVDLAVKYLRGVKGTLVQQKKRDREKAVLAKGGALPLPAYQNTGRPSKTGNQAQHQEQNHQQQCVPDYANAGERTTPGNIFQRHASHGQQGLQSIAIPGSVGEQLRRKQDQRQPSLHSTTPLHMDDSHVESALRGYLRQ